MGRKGLRVIEKSEGIIGRVVSLALANAMAALSLCLRRSVFRVLVNGLLAGNREMKLCKERPVSQA